MADQLDDNVMAQDSEQGSSDAQGPNIDNDQQEGTDEPDETMVADFKMLIKKFANEEMPNRRHELIRAREARFFWRGFQYAVYSADSGAFAVPYAGGLPMPAGHEQGDNNRLFYTLNIYTPLGKAMISALTGTIPGCRFLPKNPNDIDDIDGCNEAEKYRQYFYADVNIDQVMKEACRYAWTDGRTVAWVKQIPDEYDQDDEGNPRLKETVELFGVLENKVPIALRFMREFPYLQVATEKNTAYLKGQYPEKADKIKMNVTGPGEDTFDRICRLGTMQGTEFLVSGDTYAHLSTIQHTWMRKCAFTFVKDKARRAALEERYQKGVRVTYIGEEFIEAVEEDMDKAIALLLPMPGDGQACPALGEFLIPLQKRVNNLSNLIQETYEREAPAKFVDSKAVDTDAMADQPASPGQWVPVKRPTGTSLADMFYKEAPSTISADMIGILNSLKSSDAQMVTNVQPSIFGGSMVNSKTAAVYAQARDQALGSLGITYGPLKAFLARIVELAVDLAKTRDADAGDITGMVPDNFGGYMNINVNIENLQKGTYFCRPEVDEQFPESYSQEKQNFATLLQFAGNNPVLAQQMQDPSNQYLFQKFAGVKGFKVQGADQRNVQLREINELLVGTVIPPDNADLQKVAQHQTIASMGQAVPAPTAARRFGSILGSY